MNLYEDAFSQKIDALKSHEKYDILDRSRKEALNLHTEFGHDAIAAADFMDRIIAMPKEYISDWLDGKNHLEWTQEHRDELERIEKNGFRLVQK